MTLLTKTPGGVQALPPVLPRRHPWRYVGAGVALLLVVWAVDQILGNEAFEWTTTFATYFFDPSVLKGLWATLWLTAAVIALSLVFGVLVAAMRMSANPVLQVIAWVYVWIFRSAPLLVQLLLWFNIGYIYPVISLGIPWGPAFLSAPANDLISATTAAILGLTMHTVAYASEIIRGGILAVPGGQTEAAQVLGFGPVRTFVRVVLPQSMRSIIPSIGNLTIDLLKSTSIVSVLAVPDLLYSVQMIYNQNYRILPLLMVATVWYIAITSILSIGQYYIERYYARGSSRALPLTPVQRIRLALTKLTADRRGPVRAYAKPDAES